MSNDKIISIVIPVFNQSFYTKQCIYSILHNSENFNYEIIVVDNASTDDTEQIIKEFNCKQKITYIKNKRNLGFAKACNRGAEKAKGEYLVFLNNDTEVIDGWLSSRIEILEREDVGIVGVKMLYPNRTIQHAGISIMKNIQKNFLFWPTHVNRNLNEFDNRVNKEFEPHAVTGACLFIKNKLFKKVNGFSTEYKMYFEDIDLCFKVKKIGKQIVYNPKSTIIHYEGKSSQREDIDKLNISSSKIFFKKWKKYLEKQFIKRDIIWAAPFFNPSGYASEAISFVLGIKQYVNIRVLHDNNNFSQNFVDNMPSNWRHDLYHLCAGAPLNKNITLSNETILISHQPANSFLKNEIFKYHIGRTMFETYSIPSEWVDSCNRMDEIWVPSKFNKRTFEEAGVEKDKLIVIPGAIDVNIFNPITTSKLDLEGEKKYRFLSIFEWTERKGAEILLSAYFEEFSNEDDVCLYLRTYILSNYDTDSGATITSKIDDLIVHNEYNRSTLPNYVILSEQLPFDEMVSLYNSVDCFVLPSRGEGWGRPYMEAMAMELPVIGTNWSGNTEFMNNNNSYLLDIDGIEVIENMEIPFYKGQKWAKPSLRHLKILMRNVFENQEEAREIGKNARKEICENYSLESVAEIVWERLKVVETIIDKTDYEKSKIKNITSTEKKISVIWEGPQFVNSSLALVNRELCSGLAHSEYNLSLVKTEKDTFIPTQKSKYNILTKSVNKKLEKTDIHVRHHWPPNLTPPEQGHWVVIQPWEFGSLPTSWAEVFSTQVDEIWVYSNYVKQIYLDASVNPERVFVVPLGFDPAVFNTKVKPFKLKTKKKFKFLFVGGTIYRKGIDILLNAFTELFTKDDDVCLVIKDMGGNSFYDGQIFSKEINEIIQDENAPEIEYIDKFLSEEELKGLYQSADVLVHPYRGEGFGLPILESMACGTPVIVTNGGAALDFCNSENSFLVDAEKTYYKEKKVGELETVDHPWLYEVSIEALKSKMKYVFDNKIEIVEKGNLAFQYVNSNFTWKNSAEKINERIELLSMKPIARFKRMYNEKMALFSKYINDTFKFIDNGNHLEALNSLNLALESFIKNNENQITLDELLNVKGSLYLATNNLEKAKETFEAALNENPNSSLACQGIGDIFQMIEEYEASKTMYEWAIKNGMESEGLRNKLNAVNIKLGLEPNHNSLEIIDEEPLPTIEEVEELITSSDLAGAEYKLNKILVITPSSVDALNDLAIVKIMQNNFEEALTHISSVISIDPSNKIALESLNYIESEINSIK